MDKTKEVKIIDKKIIDIGKNRFSARQKRKIPMNGFKGTLAFFGDYGSLLPLLKVGEYIHLGKDTVFGYGKYSFWVKK